MDESFVNNIYKKAFKYFLQFIGNDTSTTDQLESVAHDVFGKDKFVGVLPSDIFIQMLPKMKAGSVGIINNQQSDELGEHWLCIFKPNKKEVMIHDTFGRKIFKLIPILKKLKGKGIKVIETDRDKEQKPNENNCGVHALSACFIADQFGPKAFKLL